MTRLTWVIAWHEYTVTARKPSYLFSTFVSPLLGSILVFLLFTFAAATATGPAPASQRVGVVDPIGALTPLPEAFTAGYLLYPDAAAAKAALLAGETAGYLVLPEDFRATGKITAFEAQSLGVAFGGGLSPRGLRPLLATALLSDAVAPATLALATAPDLGRVEAAEVLPDGTVLAAQDALARRIARLFVPYAVVFGLLGGLLGSSSYLVRAITEERESRVLEVVLGAVGPLELLWGKVLGLGAAGLTQVGVWGTYGLFGLVVSARALLPAVFAQTSLGNAALALVYAVLGYLQFAMIVATVGALGTRMRSSQAIGTQLAFLPTIPVALAPLVLADPTSMVFRVWSLLPLFGPTMMMVRLPFGGVPTLDVVGSVVVSGLAVPACIVVAARVFRASLLLQGQRLGFKALLAALFAN